MGRWTRCVSGFVAKLFKYGAALAGYDVRVIIDDGMGEVETTYWHAAKGVADDSDSVLMDEYDKEE